MTSIHQGYAAIASALCSIRVYALRARVDITDLASSSFNRADTSASGCCPVSMLLKPELYICVKETQILCTITLAVARMSSYFRSGVCLALMRIPCFELPGARFLTSSRRTIPLLILSCVAFLIIAHADDTVSVHLRVRRHLYSFIDGSQC